MQPTWSPWEPGVHSSFAPGSDLQEKQADAHSPTCPRPRRGSRAQGLAGGRGGLGHPEKCPLAPPSLAAPTTQSLSVATLPRTLPIAHQPGRGGRTTAAFHLTTETLQLHKSKYVRVSQMCPWSELPLSQTRPSSMAHGIGLPKCHLPGAAGLPREGAGLASQKCIKKGSLPKGKREIPSLCFLEKAPVTAPHGGTGGPGGGGSGSFAGCLEKIEGCVLGLAPKIKGNQGIPPSLSQISREAK